MDMEYWQNSEGQVYGFDVSDPSQVEAMNQLLSTGTWTNVTGSWPPPPPPPTAEQNKQTAVNLLSQTDWTALPDVADPLKSNPYLANANAFNTYRNAVRQYAINPVAGEIVWPTTPTEDWQSP
jgi:hypothetical protein